MGPAVAEGQCQASGHAGSSCRSADRLLCDEAWNLRRHELPRTTSRVRTRGPFEPGLFLCVFDHGLHRHAVRAPCQRRFPARGCADLCRQRARGDVCRGLPFALRVLGTHGDFILAFGIAAPRDIGCGSGVPLSPGSHIRRTASARRNRTALVPDRLACLRGYGSLFGRPGLGVDPRRVSPQCGGSTTRRMASGRVPRSYGDGCGLHDCVHDQVGSLRPAPRFRRHGAFGVVGRGHGGLRRRLRRAGK